MTTDRARIIVEQARSDPHRVAEAELIQALCVHTMELERQLLERTPTLGVKYRGR